MADVLLREYVDQLRDTLHAAKYADAFALGQHILHFFPKHVETYTLLAQACLETDDLAGATDLFRRVLSADPENILALAGMALLSETQDKYDDALWYLERAYEVQPSNDDLRRELLRVREMFYGAAPARLELTSGALARVYARQGQYAHAVNEYRRLLRTDSKRYDARVGLAETLYRAGRTDEAAQVAQSVMADAPFALKPNLILGTLWSENAVPEGQQFLKRAQQLDPEHRVARQLIGAHFADGQPPRLPPLGESAISSPLDDQEIGAVSQTFTTDAATARAAEFLRELERTQEPEADEEEPLFGDLDALSLVENIPLEPIATEKIQAPSQPVAEEIIVPPLAETEAAPLVAETRDVSIAETLAPDTPLQEIAHAEQVSPPPAPTKKKSDFAARLTRSKTGEGVSTDAIAAAANALAASIALDKSSQPAPTRRAHPSIPKVRPVIRGAAEKLPTWLRLGATPAAASASFDVAPPSSTETIAPITTPPEDRPAWLVEAQEVAAREPLGAQEPELPAWLKAAPTEIAKPIVETPRADVPSWLRDEPKIESPRVNESAPVQPPATAVAMPEWLSDETETPQAVAPVIEETPAVVQERASAPVEQIIDEPILEPVIEPEPPVAIAETISEPIAMVETVAPEPVQVIETIQEVEAPVRETTIVQEPVATIEEPAPPTPTQVMPDSATMLQMARDKRAEGDLKGALDLYERVMHRRPNYLEQITSDLQQIIQAGGAPTSANRLLGEAYAMVGRFKESLEQYRIAMGK